MVSNTGYLEDFALVSQLSVQAILNGKLCKVLNLMNSLKGKLRQLLKNCSRKDLMRGSSDYPYLIKEKRNYEFI